MRAFLRNIGAGPDFLSSPTALRTSDQNSIYAPPVFQALLAIPQLHTRLKRSPTNIDHEESDEEIKRMLEGPKQGMFVISIH